MVKRITPGQVETFVVGALEKANRTYCKLSGGEWVTGRGVESFLGYFVAQPFLKFFSPSKACVKLEVSQKEFREEYMSGLKWPKRKSRGRFDVVVLWKEGLHALGVIELKRDQYFGGWKKDIKRLASIVMSCRKTNRTKNKFQFGCFAAFASEWEGDEWIEDRTRDLRILMKKTQQQRKVKVRIFRSSLSNFESYRYNKESPKGRVRSDVIGCVFYK